MERAAHSMITKARRSADHVADRVLRGIDARREVILTDVDGHVAWRAKRFARPVYRTVMRRVAHPSDGNT
jgi:hypothetical protein